MLSLRQFLSLSAAAGIVVHVSAQNRVQDNDIPQQCRSTCQPLIDQSRNCDDQYSQNDQNDAGDQNYRNCICGAQNANNYIPQCDACIVQDPNYQNNNNGINGYNNNGYNEVNQWMQTCNFPSTNYNGINGGIGNLNPTLTYGGYANPTGGYYNGGDGYGLAYQTIYDQNGNPEVIQTPIPTAGVGNGGYYNGYDNGGYITTYDQYGNPQVINTLGQPYQSGGGYYPGNVIGGNYGNPVSVSYTTTTSTDQFGQGITFVTPVSTYYASLTTSWSTTRSTDAFGNTETYSVPYVSYTGAANAVATAKAVVGAGAGLLMAALAL